MNQAIELPDPKIASVKSSPCQLISSKLFVEATGVIVHIHRREPRVQHLIDNVFLQLFFKNSFCRCAPFQYALASSKYGTVVPFITCPTVSRAR